MLSKTKAEKEAGIFGTLSVSQQVPVSSPTDVQHTASSSCISRCQSAASERVSQGGPHPSMSGLDPAPLCATTMVEIKRLGLPA